MCRRWCQTAIGLSTGSAILWLRRYVGRLLNGGAAIHLRCAGIHRIGFWNRQRDHCKLPAITSSGRVLSVVLGNRHARRHMDRADNTLNARNEL